MPRPMPRTRLTAAAALCLAALSLAACGGLPDLRRSRPAPPPPPPSAAMPAPPPAAAAPEVAAGLRPPASTAEDACRAAGQARGFDVRAIAGSAEVTGQTGAPESRDVMLRVARGAQVFDVRCNYHYPSGTARVMAL